MRRGIAQSKRSPYVFFWYWQILQKSCTSLHCTMSVWECLFSPQPCQIMCCYTFFIYAHLIGENSITVLFNLHFSYYESVWTIFHKEILKPILIFFVNCHCLSSTFFYFNFKSLTVLYVNGLTNIEPIFHFLK